jgi:hypothetical protein
MPRFIPAIDPGNIPNTGEREVALALKEQLDDSCTVLHSVPWLNYAGEQKKFLAPGETDFIIIDPARGLMLLEVKGYSVRFDPDTRTWYYENKTSRTPAKDPFKQAADNLGVVREKIKARFQGKIPFPFGFCVAFPMSEIQGGMPAGASDSILVTCKDMPRLGDKIRNALCDWNRFPDFRPFTKEITTVLENTLFPVFKILPSRQKELEYQEEKLFRMTEEQAQTMEGIKENSRVAVKGVAGSGKTLVAMARAQEFAREGKKTLFMCYNRLLADWLQLRIPDDCAANLRVETFHGIALEFARKAGLPLENLDESSSTYWSDDVPDALERACNLLGDDDKFDVLIVDEGQDFLPYWWLVLEKVRRDPSENGPLYIFFDPQQKIYLKNVTLPLGLFMFNLKKNCRNTRNIGDYFRKSMNLTVQMNEGTPEGAEPRIEKIQASELDAMIERQVESWASEYKLKASSIAVLSPQKHQPRKKYGKYDVTHSLKNWSSNNGILFDTHRRFKGLEADAIILAGVPKPQPGSNYTPEDHYVASSRAKHLLTVFEV